MTPPTEEETAALAAAAEAERERYQELKLELQLWTLAAGGLGMAACWAFYSLVPALPLISLFLPHLLSLACFSLAFFH